MLSWVRYTGSDLLNQEMRHSKKKGDIESFGGAVPLDRIQINNDDVKKSLFLRFCNALNMFTTLTMLCSIFANAYFAFFPCNKLILFKLAHVFSPAGISDVPIGVVRLFSVLFAILVIFAEQENGFIVRHFSFLNSWVFRGLFIVFIGSLQILIKVPCELLIHYQVNLAIGVAAGSLGILYSILGMLCFRQLRTRQLDQIRRKKQVELQVCV